MNKLLTRLLLVALTIALSAMLWNFGFAWLDGRRHPQRQLAMQYLHEQLGTMTPDQIAQADAAILVDPLATMLAAKENGWEGIRAVARHDLSTRLQVETIGLRQFADGNTNAATASDFVDRTLRMVEILRHDPNYHIDPLDDVRHLSPEEFSNVVADDSYLIIAPRIAPQYRQDFQRNQATLTPLLSMADPAQWNGLMADFEKAKPEVVNLFRDHPDPLIGYVYMLQSDKVKELVNAGVNELDAIEFLGVNTASVNQAAKTDPRWAAGVQGLQSTNGPDGKPLFQICLKDPFAYGLVASDPSPDRKSSRTILVHYAGSAVPAIIQNYAQTPAMFTAALETVSRFGCSPGASPKSPDAAVGIIAQHQDDPNFKNALAAEGPRLVAALLVAGDDRLVDLYKPQNLDVYVDADGKAKGKPLYTWVPGGNVAYVVVKLSKGQTTTFGDWGWAVVDGALLFVPLPGLDGLGNAVVDSGEQLVEKEAETGVVDVVAKTLPFATEQAGEVLEKQAAKSAIRLSEKEAGETAERFWATEILKSAGLVTTKVSLWAVEHPGITMTAASAIAAGTYLTMTPEQRERVWNWILEHGGDQVHLPPNPIPSIADAMKKQLIERPMLSGVFLTLATLITALFFLIPLMALRLLLPDVYHLLVALVKGAFNALLWLPRLGWRHATRGAGARVLQ
jgi:hypothetical protein